MQIHAAVNAERTNAGLTSLNYSAELASLARGHSADMFERNYFSHNDPDGCGMTCRFKAAGYSYWAIGENIYSMSGYELSEAETAAHIVAGWMSSSGHRANILKDNFTTEGIGVVETGDTLYVTQNLAKPR